MKSKITKIQKILMKGIAVLATGMMLASPIAYATTSLDDSYLESSWWEQILYGKIGSTAKEIEEYFNSRETTLYITNETQLRALAEYVNNGNSCEGKEIVLLNDIELDSTNEWVPIAKNGTVEFQGTFNGNNYTISGIRYSRGNKTYSELIYVGLFGIIGKNGTVHNIVMKNNKIDIPYYEEEESYEGSNTYNSTGIIVGKNKGTIKNCIIIESEINGLLAVGGIVGTNVGKIENCINNAVVYGYAMTGGITGQNHKYEQETEGKIINCTNKGKISGKNNFVGGIAGQNRANATVLNSINEGIVVTEGSYVGGITGVLLNSTIENCYNTGRITGNKYSGGIAGALAQESITGVTLPNSIIKNSINEGKVIEGENSIGGIVKTIGSGSYITGCIDYSALASGESGKVVNLSNGTTIKQSYKITDTLTQSDVASIVIDNFDNVYKFDASQGKIVFKNTVGATIRTEQGITETIDATTGLTVTYKIQDGHYKAGDTIEISTTYNKKLYTSLGTSNTLVNKETAPKLTMKIDETTVEFDTSSVTISDKNTIVTYTKTVTDDMINGKAKEISLKSTTTYYAIEGSIPTDTTTYPNYRISSINKTIDLSNNNIIVDTVKPTINTKVYVENALETGRYTAGKEILFEVTTSEKIQGLYEVPQIQVSFSESEIGKYNYRKEEGREEGESGFAKCKSAVINLDGTTTWTFSYIVQERDEGKLEFTFTAGKMTDLAGNITNIKELYTANKPEADKPLEIKGTEWDSNLGVTFKFYKNDVSGEEITSQTYFTNEDDLVVVATYDKVLYVYYGQANDSNANTRLTNAYKDKAPSLYLNGTSNLKQSSIDKVSTTEYNEETKTSGKTTVQYRYTDIAKNYKLEKLTQITALVLKNENNEGTEIKIADKKVTANGDIPYSEEYHSEYKSEEQNLYELLNNLEVKTTTGLDDIIIDPIGVSTKIEKSDIYADTTAPTVEITADKANPTNADLIKYTFKFSEVVEGFTGEDITVNNGIKATKEETVGEEKVTVVDLVTVEEGKEYTLEVEPLVTAGSNGDVTVIVEQNACKDLVGYGNVRTENTITVDKKAPTVEIKADKDYVKVGENINYTINFSEAVKDFDVSKLIVNNATIVENSFKKVNDSQYTMQVTPTNGNDVEVIIENNKFTDIAGNNNIGNKNIITVIPTLTITTNTNNPTNKGEIEYTFTWSEEVVGFTAEDIIVNDKASKGILSEVVENENGTYSYKMVVDYNSLIPSGNEGEITVSVIENAVQDKNGNGNAQTSNTTKIDRIAPIFESLEAYTTSNIGLNSDVDIVKEYFNSKETITIIATFNENVVKKDIPKLVLQFSESGNAKGSITSDVEGNKIIYTYKVTNDDNGEFSIRALNGKVTDAAGNETAVAKKILDGNTIIADTKAPTLKALNVISDKIANKATEKITIEAVYDENVYALITKEDATKEIVNITNENAPKLDISFGGVKAKGEMTAEYAENDKTRIIYTYTVAGEEEAGDNGKLKINGLVNNENAQVCDIAGNTSENHTETKTTKDVLADTISPKVDEITAVGRPGMTPDNKTDIQGITDEDGTTYYKAGSIIDVTIESNEPIATDVITVKYAFKDTQPTEAEYKTDTEGHLNTDNSNKCNFTVEVDENENGYLWVKVDKGEFTDIAGNGNIEKTSTKINNIYADTTAPNLAINESPDSKWKLEYIKENGIVTGVTATGVFSEKMFSINNNTNAVKNLDNQDIPTLGFFINGELKETQKVATIGTDGRTFTYTMDISKISAKPSDIRSANLIDGKLYDRAGNEFTIELSSNDDMAAPIFKDIKVLTQNGFYKAGEVIEIVARFEEQTTLTTVPTLIVRLGDRVITLDNGVYNADDKENTDRIKVARYSVRIQDTDNGPLNIISLKGTASDGGKRPSEISKIYIDTTDDEVNDVNGKPEELLNSLETQYANTDEEYKNVIADTKAPYIKSIIANANDKEIATYTKEEGKDPVTEIKKKTNSNTVEYLVEFSEPVPTINKNNISITNGIINPEDINVVENTKNTKYKITVQQTVEGVQSLLIGNDAVRDRAGNSNAFERFNIVTVDFTKPTIRFISEYNGGIYVLPTNIGKVEIRPNVEISEDIETIEYKWDDGEYKPIENYSSSSDIAIPTKAFTEAGEYVLSIRVKDLAGNVAETSKTYTVKNSNIDIELSTYEYTNQDITATVSFGEGLTDNRKVTFKAEGSNEVVELNVTATNENGIEYTIGTNGTIYVEATDKVGNKVFTEKVVNNIDKEDPIIELEINGANLVIGTEKDKATIKTKGEVEDANLKDIKYIYSNNETLTDEEKAAMQTIDNYGEAKTTDAVEGTYYLHVLATDKAGNETEYKSLPFIVANSNILKDDEGNITFTPANENTINFERQQQYVYVTYGSTLSEEQNITFTNKDDGDALDGYAQVLKPTTVTATASDVCGNTVIATYVVESVEGPEFEVIGNPKNWTNQDVKLEVSTYDALKALTVNGTDILSKEANIRSNIVVSENGDYEFIATDTYGNISKKTVKVEKIDKGLPVISKVENEGKDITITATDELSGVAEYAITSTTETPVEWSKSNVIKTTKDGTFYIWAKDNAGNVTMKAEAIIVDTTAPTIAFNYSLSTVNVGTPIETTITTNEDAKISYSWDNETWVDSEEFITSLKVSKETRTTGSYTLYAKATDKSGNTSKVQTIKFTVIENPDNIKTPEIIFEDLPIIQVNGVKYVKIFEGMTTENLASKMNKQALLGKTPEYIKLTKDNKLRTGSEITINGETKYIVVVKGDINCDGKAGDFIEDIMALNRYRIKGTGLSTEQILAGDINNDRIIDFIDDIMQINRYRIGIISIL